MASSRTTALTSFGLGVALTIAGATLTGTLNLGGQDISNIATASGAILKGGGGLYTINGSAVKGPNITATSTLSGATMKAGGGLIVAGPTGLLIAPTHSGSFTMNVATAGKSSTDSLRIPCIKLSGVMGYAIRTATGFIQSVCN